MDKIIKAKKKLRQTESATTPTSNPGASLSDIQERQLHWLWEKRILRGKLTLLDADPGLGKSLITLDLAARITAGRPMPDGTPGLQGNVILIAPEDDIADTIKPRVLAAGGDPSRIRVLTVITHPDPSTGRLHLERFTLPTHFNTLFQSVERTKAVLVIIDPLISVLDRNISVSHDQDMRSVLPSLAGLALYADCAFLLVRHLNKGSLNNPLYRGSGSIGIIASARTGLLVVRDPNDENKRVLTTTKNNLSAKAPNLVYNITTNPEGIPTINWLGISHIPVTNLLNNTSSLSTGRQLIINLLHESDTPLSPKAIAEQTGQVDNPVRLILKRMLNAQEVISPAYGLYTVPGHRSLKTPSLNKKTTPQTPAVGADLSRPAPIDRPSPQQPFPAPETLDTPNTVDTLDTVNHLDSNFSDTNDTPNTPNTVDTLDTVSLPDSNSSDTPDTPDTPDTLDTLDTLDIPNIVDTPDTLDIVGIPDIPNPPHSNSTPLPIAPTPSTIPINLYTITKKIRTLFYCTRDIHYNQWVIHPTKIGCPICDSWVVRVFIGNSASLALYDILNQPAPRENENRQAWLERIAPFISVPFIR